MIKIGIAGVSTTFAGLSASFMGLLLKYVFCHVIFILEISLLNMFLPFVTKKYRSFLRC